LANVFFGGTLVLDIPSLDKQDHAKIREGMDRYHEVEITRGSGLESITGTTTGFVNSAHHQSALVVADNLVINAMSEDGVIEGLERNDFYHHPYLMLVQWHPERMTDQGNVLSFNVKKSFLDAVDKTMHAEKAKQHNTCK
jgi:putative glutamine amidotransferase